MRRVHSQSASVLTFPSSGTWPVKSLKLQKFLTGSQQGLALGCEAFALSHLRLSYYLVGSQQFSR